MRKQLTQITFIVAAVATALLINLSQGFAAPKDFFVYSVYTGLNMGNPDEATRRDYYINMGTNQGLRPGSVLEVFRKTSTYDLVNKKLYKDMTLPFAKIKVIHVEEDAAVARLEEILPNDKSAVVAPRAVIVGDFVKTAK
ncbi:MAG: FlgT C-terminal domain-containing protein [Bacteriovoracia bacterium]